MTTYSDPGAREGFLKGNAELVGVALRFLDLTIIVLGAIIAHLIRFDELSLGFIYKIALVVLLFAAALIFPMFDLYKPWRGLSIWSEVRTLVFAWLTIAAILPALVYFTKTGADYSRLWFGYWVLITTILLMASRLILRSASRWARRKGLNTRNVVIIGAGDLGQQVCFNLQRSEWAGINVVGFLDDNIELQGKKLNNVPVFGGTDLLNNTSNNGSEVPLLGEPFRFDVNTIDQVWVALPISSEQEIRNVCSSLEDSAISIIFVPDIFLHGLLNHSVDDLAGMPVVNLRSSPIEGTASTLKLVEDLTISLCAIALTGPLMLLIAIAIKLDSRGPILFKQRRYGIDGKEITVWKFRTMVVQEDAENVVQATKNDPRVTRIGAFLRRTSLDELPQFFNVLQGRMSVVGPRPHAVAHNEQYRKIIDRYMWRCKVKPGITGWAQVNGWRGETETTEKMEKRVEYDLDYLKNWSIWMDLKIVLRTIVNGFSNKNAY
ncbi:MAG: undecaprenyl-phosphate glucose phosphotransferase [bacterium]